MESLPRLVRIGYLYGTGTFLIFYVHPDGVIRKSTAGPSKSTDKPIQAAPYGPEFLEDSPEGPARIGAWPVFFSCWCSSPPLEFP
jgi:hypothetical protein